MTARLWNLRLPDAFTEPEVLEGHQDKVKGVAFSPNSRWLVTFGYDHSPRLWDLSSTATKRTSIALRGHSKPVESVAFSANGRWLATACHDGVVRMWSLVPEDLENDARRAAGRNLREDEWRAFFPGEPYRRTFESLDIPTHLWVN